MRQKNATAHGAQIAWMLAARGNGVTNEDTCTGCNEKATTKDDAGHPLCKDCFDDLDPEASPRNEGDQ